LPALLIRRVLALILLGAGVALAYMRIASLNGEGRFVGSMLAGFFFLIYALPLAGFGASVVAVEAGLQVQQYVSAVIPYSEVRACFDWLLPPFHVAIIVTRRRFPLCLLVSGQRTIGNPGGLVVEVKKRMRSLGGR
jgi:hypothetical protein